MVELGLSRGIDQHPPGIGMELKPASIQHLSELLRNATETGGKVASCDLSGVNGLVEHKPADMTATVQAGMRLQDFQEKLRSYRQWLPIDPPRQNEVTVGEVLMHNLSGPRRYGYGTIRDYLIGIKVAMADGQIIKAGGKVVKNVAGYDLCKLFVGSQMTLGIVVEATFKLWPLPEAEVVMEKRVESLLLVSSLAQELLRSRCSPIILDAHNLEGKPKLVAAFVGAREDVEFQEKLARELGFSDGSLSYEENFWRDGGNILKKSVLPSETAQELEKLVPREFVARYGNGVIYVKQAETETKGFVPSTLMQRLKQAYDPAKILPEHRQ